MATHYRIKRKDGAGAPVVCEAGDLMGACERLSEGGTYPLDVAPVDGPSRAPVLPADDDRTEPGGIDVSSMVLGDADIIESEPASVARVDVAPYGAVSNFGAGQQVSDDAARVRIEAQHSALRAAGVNVNAAEQLYATGTRLAAVGYDTQASRKAEHDRKLPVRDAVAALVSTVEAEKREDVTMSAREVARGIGWDSRCRLTLDGFTLSETAIRGLLARLDSRALSYVLSLASRNGEADGVGDATMLRRIVTHECMIAGDVEVKLRRRGASRDVFAVVSPSYSPADAPAALGPIVDALPSDARGSYSYDPTSTAWELRAEVWTPTPVATMAVGEAFEGFASFSSRDNGTRKLGGGGGISLLRCLNASTYTAEASSVNRRHVGAVLDDVRGMVDGATAAIRSLAIAWGLARKDEVEAPGGVPIEEALPGWFRYILQDRRGELLGVLPGRTEAHVSGLVRAFHGERRDANAPINRADLAQGLTRYVQDLATPVRRDAESAIGAWVVNGRKVGCDVREASA